MILGVLSDTHIPDRVRGLRPEVLTIFKHAGVGAILHAGDVCTPAVLDQLAQVAPVHAVRGNRDIYLLRDLPLELMLEFEGVKIGMMHGHGGWQLYLLDKLHWIALGVQEERYRRRAMATFAEAKLIIFGHLHRPVNIWVDGKLLFNPGSASVPDKSYGPASVGLVYLEEGKVVKAEIVRL